MSDFHIFAPIPAIRKRTRLVKVCAILRNAGVGIRYYGWTRDSEDESDQVPEEGVTEKIILRGGGYGTVRTRLYYPLWMIAVLWQAMRLPRRGTWYCLGFESAFPALLVAKWKDATIVFDDADRFSMIFHMPGPLRKLVVSAERWVSRNSDLHLVPGFTRYEWHNPKMRLLRNSPTSDKFAVARDLSKSLEQSGARPFTIYVNGWIGETRGAPIFLALMKRLLSSRPTVKMLLIGRGDSGEFDELVRMPNVEYIPAVKQEVALSHYYGCDLVLTYYDPRIEINRHAESNKWGDCVFCGVPFVVNREVETASKFIEAGAAFAVDYDDVNGLFTLVGRCIDDPAMLERARSALSGLREDFQPFDCALAEILEKTLPYSAQGQKASALAMSPRG